MQDFAAVELKLDARPVGENRRTVALWHSKSATVVERCLAQAMITLEMYGLKMNACRSINDPQCTSARSRRTCVKPGSKQHLLHVSSRLATSVFWACETLGATS